MAEYENSEDLTATCEGEIADLLQADLNLRSGDWVNSSTEELTEEANEVQEEICESLIEEVIVEQENDNYITCLDEDCMEESIVYVFEEPVIEFDLNDSHYIIQEPITYDMEGTEPTEASNMNSDSCQGSNKNDSTVGSPNVETVICEENVLQETSKVEISGKNINNFSDNKTINKCISDLPTSDSSLKTCNVSENSDSVDNLLINNVLVDKKKEMHEVSEIVEVQTPVQMHSLYGEDDPVTNIIIDPVPETKLDSHTLETDLTPEIDQSQIQMSSLQTSPVPPILLRTPPNMLPSVLNKNKLSPLKRTPVHISSDFSSPTENKSSVSDNSTSPATRISVLGKDQMKKRLQSFSLLKQGIQAIPIKKIISPKQPKVQMQMGEVYDETGKRIDEKVIIKKPPKQGPTPSEKARQVIDEIEQIKKEEAAIYEQTLSFMKNSMRDAYKKKSRIRVKDRRSPVKKDKKYEKDYSKSKNRRSSESDRFHGSPEHKNDKKRDKSVERERRKDNEMPQNWTEIKRRNINIQKISEIKQKNFKFSERQSTKRNNKRGYKFGEEEKTIIKKDDFVKPQLMFEFPSLLRESFRATSVKGKIKYYPPECIRFTEKLPNISYCENPKKVFRNRKQILNEIPEERAEIMMNIIENKTGPIDSGLFTSGIWYSKEYLPVSKNEIKSVTSYGLSVLSQMYDDEQEEIQKENNKRTKDKKTSSKKKRHKSKSRSRSKSKENLQKIEKEDSKCKHLIHKNTDVNKSVNIPKENTPNASSFKEKHVDHELEDETPNTDEYRSNWESDEDILNEIMPQNDCTTYNKSYHKNWKLEEDIDKYKNRRQLNNERWKERKRDSLEFEDRPRRQSEEDKRKYDTRLDVEDLRFPSHMSEEKIKSDLKSNNRDFENLEYGRRSEENQYTNRCYEKTESKSSDFGLENEERKDIDYKFSSNLRRSEEKERIQHNLEFDYKKSRNLRRESIERYDSGHNRRISESDRYKKLSDELKQVEIKSVHSLERDKRKSNDFKGNRFRHDFQESDFKKSKKINSEEIINVCELLNQEDKKFKESRRDSFETIGKHEPEEKSYYSLKQDEELKFSHVSKRKEIKSEEKGKRSINFDEKAITEETKRDRKSFYYDDNDRRRDLELENRSLTPDYKKTNVKESNKLNNEEDIHKSFSIKQYRRNVEAETSKIDEQFLNLNLNYQKSQWSSDEECEKSSISEDKRSHNFVDDLPFLEKNEGPQNRWEQNLEIEPENYRKINRYDNLLDSDLVNLKELERNRKITEEIKERRSKEEYTLKSSKKKLKVEKNYMEEKEKYKRNKKKNKEKKNKFRIKNEITPKVKITYSDLEDSYDEDFRTAKQKEQDFIFKSDNNKKYAAKIKIDYSDFDVSLIESKDKYEKKIEELNQKTPEILRKTPEFTKNIDLNLTPHVSKIERKLNIDLSEITIEQKSTMVHSIDLSPKEKVESFQKFKETVIPGRNEPLEVINESSLKDTRKSDREVKTEIEGIAPVSPIIDTKSPVVPLTIVLPEIIPVAPPLLPIPKPIDLPVTPDPNKLVSEYEEFMKAVCFDEPKDHALQEKVLETTKEIKQIEQTQLVEEVTGTSKEEESNTSSEESSSEDNTSEDHTDSGSHSESLSPDSARNKMLETVANIKTEKFTDSENESQESIRVDKRKRSEHDSNSETETFDDIIIKSERDNSKKFKHLEEIQCENKYDNIIDWEKSCSMGKTKIDYSDFDIESKSASDSNSKTTDISEIIPSCVLPENIPLPTDTLTEIISVQDIPTPDLATQIQSPIDVICISECLTSPTKKTRSFIPIKLLTAETRKQANETAKLEAETSGFGKFTPSDIVIQTEDKITTLGSTNDISQVDSENIATVITSETTEDSEQNVSRKRQSQWNLNLTPVKKPLLQNALLGNVDSDEDFTEKFIKQSEKKQESPLKQYEESKEKPDVENELEKSDLSNRDDKKEVKKLTIIETRKAKDELDEKSRRNDKPHEKSRHSVDRHSKDEHKSNRRSPTPPKLDKRPFLRFSRERTEKYDKNDRNDRRDKPRDSLDRKGDRVRDRSRERSRDRSTREFQRDRDKRRLSDRRLPERKPPVVRGRSPRSRYSRERESQRPRPRDRSKDRQNKYKEPERDRERDRSRERIRERERSRDRDHREKDDRRNYRRDRHSRSSSPPRKDFRLSMENISNSHHRIDDTDFSTTNMDIVQSPVNSPLDGFKRSLADSTISDSELVTQLNTPDESNEPSPAYSNQQYYPSVQEIPPECQQSPSSPKRISLDDRINLVLGIEKEPPKQIDTVCTRGPYMNNPQPNYHDPYGYNRAEYDLYNSQQPEGYVPVPYSNQYPQYYPNQLNTDNNIKVVQVGNVIQVVPTEQPAQQSTSTHVPKPNDVPPKVVQVGNMLQIVPVTIIDTSSIESPLTTVAPTTVVDKAAVPKPTDQMVLERRAEKEKRRQEREQRRKEKDKKRKEKEKRRQLKIKLKTENMIKRALMLETGEGELDISNIDTEPAAETNDNNNLPLSWPPASVLTTVPLPKPPGKGILVTHGLRGKDDLSLDDSTENRKVVKFADGICPGEGTSPSAGEELPSPPPPPKKLPKEKRYKKLKNKNKKKIKVKIIRTQQQAAEEDDLSEDNLPPPPPPPGSPPPHLWPPRVKQPPVNNIHPSLPGSVFPPAYPAPQQVMYPPAYPPIAAAGQSVPVVVGHAPPPPPPQTQRHHPPVMPVLQTGPPPPPPHHGSHVSSFHH